MRPSASERVPLAEAAELFRQRGDLDKVRLLSYRRKDYLVLYELRGFTSYFHGYMVPSAGYLQALRADNTTRPASSSASPRGRAWSWSRWWTTPS